VKAIRADGAKAVAGVSFGPAAADRNDPAYTAFAERMRFQFAGMLGTGKSVKKVESPSIIGRVRYDRIVATKGIKRAAVILGTEGGRCVAYWYFGTRTCFGQFTTGVGKARWTPRK
ncbi:hypothetical protein LCGC14_2819630, partial [marine sediment metagenome]